MTVIVDKMTMLGCRLRVTDFLHDGKPCYRLMLDMPDPHDGRHAEVLLDEDDMTAIIRGVREWDER